MTTDRPARNGDAGHSGGDSPRSKPLNGSDEAVLDHLLVETVSDYAIFRLDSSGNIQTWNAGAQRIKGYRADEIIGRHFSVFYTPDDLATEKPKRELEIASRTGKYEEEGWRVRKDGSRFWANVLITALRGGHGELIGFAKITRDLTERRKGEEAARQAERAAAERAARDEMMAVVAHDLRSPLHTMLMSTRVIEDLSLSGDELRKQLAIIARSGERMERLIRDLLDISRIEAGRLTVVMRKEDPGDIVAETCAAFQTVLTRRGQVLGRHVPADLPRICADRGRIVQVLSNYLGNAVKFTPGGGQITVGITSTGDGVRFSVADTGPGIAAEQLPRVFDRYWQAKRTAHLGTGLGLAIAKGIAESHGGKAWAESEAGRGSTFYLLVPLVESCPD